jgi:transcriptional regulator with XRE-family HTH domain
MLQADTFWEWVDQRREELGIDSYRQLETLMGYSHGAVSGRRNSGKYPTTQMAREMARVLKVSWVEFWMKAGIIRATDFQILPRELREEDAGYLVGVEWEIMTELQGRDESFKRMVLEIIRILAGRDDDRHSGIK